MIGGRSIRAPDGTEWRVGRQWLPWRLRRRGPEVDAPQWGDGDGGAADDLFGVLLVIVAVIVLAFLLFTVIIPVIALAVEIVLLAIVLVWGVGTRLVLRRPWTVRARGDRGQELVYRATGFRRSGRVRDEVAEALARGELQPRPLEALPV